MSLFPRHGVKLMWIEPDNPKPTFGPDRPT